MKAKTSLSLSVKILISNYCISYFLVTIGYYIIICYFIFDYQVSYCGSRFFCRVFSNFILAKYFLFLFIELRRGLKFSF